MAPTRSWWVVHRAHIQAFTFFVALTLKIAVGCQSRTYPSIHTETCTRVGLLGPRGEQLEGASNITSRNQTLCQAQRRNHLVSTLFEAIGKKRFVTAWVPGTGGEDMETPARARTHGTTET